MNKIPTEKKYDATKWIAHFRKEADQAVQNAILSKRNGENPNAHYYDGIAVAYEKAACYVMCRVLEHDHPGKSMWCSMLDAWCAEVKRIDMKYLGCNRDCLFCDCMKMVAAEGIERRNRASIDLDKMGPVT